MNPSRVLAAVLTACLWHSVPLHATVARANPVDPAPAAAAASPAASGYGSASDTSAAYASGPSAANVGSTACADCHAGVYRGFGLSVHGGEHLDCEACHGPGSAHVQGETGAMLHFRAASPDSANAPCLVCHARYPALLSWQSGIHRARSVRCVDCHRVHEPAARATSPGESNAACFGCHRREAAEASLPYHHPIREEKIACRDCHDPHGGTASNNLRVANPNQLCFSCHAEYEGPFAYQHPPVTESCLKCHRAHGSMNQSLLVVSEPMLCLQCHPAHHNETGTPLVNACTNCHSSIHGSDTPSATGGSVFIDKSNR